MLGIHVHKGDSKTTKDAILRDKKKYKLKIAQIYVMNSRSFNLINIGDLSDVDCKIVVHASHITQGIWNPKKTKNGWKILKKQLQIAANIKAYGFVLHLPKRHYDEVAATICKYSQDINDILKNTLLLLEHPTYKADPNSSYEMPEKLNRLTKCLSCIKNWGYCIDTAHMWAAITKEHRSEGYKIETYRGMSKWLSALDKKTRNKIRLIHLNGSRSDSSSNKDVHAIPMYDDDKIWTSYRKKITKSGLYRLLKFAKIKKIPMIIERNRGEDEDLKKSMKLIRNKLK